MSEENNYEIVESDDMEDVKLPSTVQPTNMSLPKMMELADMLSKSTIVPVEYRNRPESVFLAIDMSNRMGLSPLVIMSNMHIVNGRTSFSGSFIAGLVRSTPLFNNVEVVWVGEKGKDDFGCYIRAMDVRTGKELKGTTVDMRMVKAENWHKNPKWISMTEQMLQYRAFSFFGRLFAGEILSGIYDIDEMEELKDRKGNMVRNPYEKE